MTRLREAGGAGGAVLSFALEHVSESRMASSTAMRTIGSCGLRDGASRRVHLATVFRVATSSAARATDRPSSALRPVDRGGPRDDGARRSGRPEDSLVPQGPELGV